MKKTKYFEVQETGSPILPTNDWVVSSVHTQEKLARREYNLLVLKHGTTHYFRIVKFYTAQETILTSS